MNSKLKIEKVDFIGIGMRKTGSSWVTKCLNEHPDIFIPEEKEIRFFMHDHKFNLGINWYLKKLTPQNKERVVGEFTPGYIYNVKSLERIKANFPDVNILIGLRNPVGRAISNYKYQKKRGLENLSNILDNSTYLENSMYFDKISQAYSIFGKDHVLVYFLEDLKNDPHPHFASIFKFLNVDESFRLSDSALNKKINATSNRNYKFPIINRKIRQLKKNLMQTQIGIKILTFSKKFGLTYLVHYIEKLNMGSHKTKTIDAHVTRQQTEKLEALLKNDVDKVEKLLGRVPQEWKKYTGD